MAFCLLALSLVKVGSSKRNMPSTSQKQHNLMAMVANDPSKAKQLGIPQSVGQEFVKADKGLKFGKGSGTRADLQKINKPEVRHGKSELFKKGGEMKESKGMMKKEVSFMKKAGAPKSMIKHEESEMKGMKYGGKTKKMATGGITKAKMGKVTAGGIKPHGEHTVQKSGHTKAMKPTMKAMKPLGMKKGGKAC